MRTPSVGLDQNQDGKFIDKYYGRIPKMLHSIPEANTWVCNPEYVKVLDAYITGNIVHENLSIELQNEFDQQLKENQLEQRNT